MILPVVEKSQPDWSWLPPPSAALEVSVVMPVRNEARRIRASLRSLAAQCRSDGTPFDRRRYEVIVLANNCNDGSAEAARRFAASQPQLALHVVEVCFPVECAHVGHARACLMDEACRRLKRTSGGAGVIASTDGDTRAAPDWLTATLAEVDGGADAVGGRVVSKAQAGDPPGLRRLVRRDDTYQRLRVRLEDLLDPDPADPWPRHHQHFGASLALRCDAYEQVGGCPPEPYLEDEALYRALRRHDLKVRHSEQVTVVTSGRRHGRVAVGLSQQLREWATLASGDKADPWVPDPHPWARAIGLRSELRRLWLTRAARRDGRNYRADLNAETDAGAPERERLAQLVEHLDIAPGWLLKRWDESPGFGVFWSGIEAAASSANAAGEPGNMPMQQAIAKLRWLIAHHGNRGTTGLSVSSRTDRVDTSRAANR